MTEENILTEEEVLSLVTGGDLSRSTALNIIKSYGNRRAIEALQQARETIPGAMQSVNELEIERLLNSCLERLDELIMTSTANWKKEDE